MTCLAVFKERSHYTRGAASARVWERSDGSRHREGGTEVDRKRVGSFFFKEDNNGSSKYIKLVYSAFDCYVHVS